MDEKYIQIIKRASDLFLKCGIRNFSMDDIARELGISKKTLYIYFENKPNLLEKMIEFSDEHEKLQFEKCKDTNLNAIGKLLMVSKMVSQNIKQFNPNILFELEKYYPELYQKFYTRKKEHIYQSVLLNLKQGIEEGYYRENLDLEVVALLYIQKLVGLQSDEFKQIQNYSEEKLFEVMFENHIRGIANEKGISYLEEQKKLLNK